MSAGFEQVRDAPAWRVTLLQRLFLTVTPIVSAAVLVALIGTHGRNRLTFAALLPVLALQILAALSPRWPHKLRAAILVAPFPFAALLAYYLTGFKGNASVVAACAVVLTALLFGRREMVVLLACLLVGQVTIAVAMISGNLAIDEVVDLATTHPLPWVRTTFVAFSTWMLLGLATTFVVQRIEGELQRTRQALTDLREEQARRIKAEAERRIAEDAALQAQKMELVGRLAAGVAHDFNNLLGVVSGWTELSLDDTASRSDRAQGREALDAAVQQGRALTRQLLALARRDSRVVGRVRLERPMKGGVGTLSRVLPLGVQLTFQQGESVDVDADETELQQVLFNLVLNARDAMPEGGGKIEVSTGIVTLDAPLEAIGGSIAAGRWARVSVKDSGSGIDPAIRGRICELFFTTKPIGLGTGLGLATVLRIAQTSGGGLTLDSAPGQGATFTVYLPIAAAAAAATGGAGAPPTTS